MVRFILEFIILLPKILTLAFYARSQYQFMFYGEEVYMVFAIIWGMLFLKYTFDDIKRKD